MPMRPGLSSTLTGRRARPRRQSHTRRCSMISACKTLVLAIALAAFCPVLASAGGAAGDPDSKAILKQLEELRKTVDALGRKVDAIPRPAPGELEELRGRISALE